MLEIEWVTEMAGLNAAFVACVPTSGSIVFIFSSVGFLFGAKLLCEPAVLKVTRKFFFNP